MKKSLSIIGAAIAASLGAGSAFAIGPAGPFTATLTISGSSAFEGAVESELSRNGSTICTNGTYNVFKANGPDMRAYTCTALAGVASTGAVPVAIYYRGEGGSVTGIAPVVRSIAQFRLNLASCPSVATASFGSTTQILCPISGYNAVQDALVPAGGLESAQVQLGFADEEPAMFIGENFPSASVYAWLGSPLSASEQATLSSAAQPLVAQNFSVYLSNNLTANNLSKVTIGQILRGEYTSWDQVPNGSGGFVSSTYLPIKLCRREAGSGTQVSASVFFNDVLLSGQAFASSGNPNGLDESLGGGGVAVNASTGAMRTCLGDTGTLASGAAASTVGASAVGTIGYISTEADGTNYHNITIDGLGNTDQNQLSKLVAQGQYDYWFEIVAMKRQGLSGAALTLANRLLAVTQSVTTGPSSPNVTYLVGKGGTPGIVNPAAYPVQGPTENATYKQYVGCVTRNGNSLTKATWQCL